MNDDQETNEHKPGGCWVVLKVIFWLIVAAFVISVLFIGFVVATCNGR